MSVSPSRCVRRAFGFPALLLLVLLLGVAPRPLAAGELSSEEQKWVRDCLKRLAANSPRVRESAERALVQMGVDVLPQVIASLGQLKGATAAGALERVLLALGRDRVVRRLTQMHEESGRATARKISALLESLGGALAPGSETTVHLVTVDELDWRIVPFGAEYALKDVLPTQLMPGRQRVRVEGRTLRVDRVGDDVADTAVQAEKPQVLMVKRMGSVSPRPLLFYWKLGTWYVAPASVVRATIGKQRVEFLDGDLDGDFMGAADYVRWDDHAFVRHHENRLLQTEKLLARYQIRTADQGRSLVLQPEGLPAMTSGQRRAMLELNVFRSRHGLTPLRFDPKRSAACIRHCRYLVLNSGDRADTSATKDGAAHHQDASLPGYTAEGAEAGASSALHGGGLGNAIRSFAATMLHRIELLSSSDETMGVGQFRQGRRGWSALWCGSGSPAEVSVPLPVPAPGERNVPVRGSGEWPRPDLPPAYYKRARGYPISVILPGAALKDVRLQLFEQDGITPVPGHVWTPKKPIAKIHSRNGGAAFFMPDAPLSRGSAYWAVFEATRSGEPVRYAWTFRTD